MIRARFLCEDMGHNCSSLALVGTFSCADSALKIGASSAFPEHVTPRAVRDSELICIKRLYRTCHFGGSSDGGRQAREAPLAPERAQPWPFHCKAPTFLWCRWPPNGTQKDGGRGSGSPLMRASARSESHAHPASLLASARLTRPGPLAVPMMAHAPIDPTPWNRMQR